MTVVIGGADTGVLNSSLNTAGISNRVGDGGGDTGSAMFVNLANGNLIYRHEDGFLASRGADFGLVRTYNARAQMGDASGFGDSRWRLSTAVSLSARQERGEQFYEVIWGDGSISDYRLDEASGLYISTDGTGAYEQLTVAGDGSASLLRGDQSIWTFDVGGRLTGSIDTNGVSMTYSYNAGRLATVTDDTGHVVTFNYNFGRLASVVALSQGGSGSISTTLVSYTYDGNGRLDSVTDRRGDVTHYSYSAEGYLEKVILPKTLTNPDANGYQGDINNDGTVDAAELARLELDRTIEFGYETVRWTGGIAGPSKVVTRVTQGDQTSTIDYNFVLGPRGNNGGRLYNRGSATITDHLGNTLTYQFNAQSNVTKTVDQLGYETSYTYDDNGNLLSITDRNGFGVVNSDSTYYQTLRQELGYATVVANLSENDKDELREAFTSRFTYDANGNLLTSTDNAGYVTTYTYTDFNQVETILGPATEAAPNGALTQFVYDAKQNLIKQTDPSGDIIEFGYDDFGNLKTQTRYLNGTDVNTATALQKQITEYSYDQWGNNNQTRTLVSPADGATAEQWITTTAIYDHFGNALSITDGEGNITRFTYDGDNRVLTIVEAADTNLARTTTNVYDAVGNRIAFTTEWDGRTVTQIYDKNDRLLETLNPATDATDSRRTIFAYIETMAAADARGYTDIEETDARNNTTTYRYNARQELVEVISPELLGEDGVTLTAYTETMAYDHEGNTISMVDRRGNTTQYVYDTRGQLWVQTLADTHVIRYSYDANAALVSLVAGMQLDAGKRQTTLYKYDEEGQLIEEIDGEGHSTHYDYDAAGNLTRIVVADDKAAAIAADNVTEFTYDLANRQVLTTYAAVADPNNPGQMIRYTESSTFDGNGNAVATTDANGHTTLVSYDALNRAFRITDAVGTVTEFSYDEDDNTTRISVTGEDSVEAAQVTTYSYNEFNELQAQTSAVGNALLSSDSDIYQRLRFELGYTKDDGGSIVAKLAADLTSQERTAIEAAFTAQYVYDRMGNTVSESEGGGGVSYYQYDELGRVVASLSAAGTLTTFFYDGSGNPRVTRTYNGIYTLVNGSVPEPDRQDVYFEQTAEFDVFNRLRKLDQPNPGSTNQRTEWNYDNFGNLISQQEGIGDAALATTYSYDNANRLLTIIEGATYTTQLTLDERGNILERIEAKDLEKERSTTYTYDHQNRLATETNAHGVVTHYAYDGLGNIAAQRVFDSNSPNATLLSEQRFIYDDLNQLQETIDELQYRTLYHYDERGNTTQIDYAVGELEAYSELFEFDANDNLVVKTNGEGDRTEYFYDSKDNLIKVTEAVGTDIERSSTYIYDDDNREIERQEASGTTSLYYDSRGNLIATQTPNGQITAYVYDAVSQLLQTIQGAGSVADDGTVTFSSEKGGTRTENVYDSRGQIISKKTSFADNSDVRLTQYAYDKFNRLITVTDPDGFTTAFDYDAFGNQKSITKGLYWIDVSSEEYDSAKADLHRPQQTTFDYDALGQLISLVDAEGNQTTYSYDLLGNLKEKTTGIATTGSSDASHPITTSYEFDAKGQLKRIEIGKGLPLSSVMTYDYDAFGNKVLERQLQSGVAVDDLANEAIGVWTETQYTYNNNGQIRIETKIDGQKVGGAYFDVVTSYEYDELGRQTEIYERRDDTPLEQARKTRLSYDEADNVISLIDPEGNEKRFGYDAAGNLVRSEQVATRAVERLIYDEWNRLTASIDATGAYSAYTYDSLGNRLSEYLYADKLPSTYDPEDFPPDTADGDSVIVNGTTWVFDAELGSSGQWFAISKPLENPVDDRLTTFIFSQTSRLTTTIEPSGLRRHYHYDSVGNLVAQEDVIDAQTEGWAVTAENLKPSVSLTWAFDLSGRLIRFESAEGTVETYEYDAAGNRTKETVSNLTKTLANGAQDIDKVIVMTYDLAGRVKSQTTGRNQQTIIYDRAGNAVEKTDALGNATYFQFDRSNQLIRQINADGSSTTYDYDEFGNVVSMTATDQGTQGYAYDKNDRLIAQTLASVKGFENGTETGSQEGSISYRYDTTGNMVFSEDLRGRGHAYQYDGKGQLIAEVDASGYARSYVYNSFGEVVEMRIYQMPISTDNLKLGISGFSDGDLITERLDSSGIQFNAIFSEFDTSGRLTKTSYNAIEIISVSTTAIAGWVQQGPAEVWTLVTQNHVPEETVTYDARGNAVRSSNRNGDITYAYFDREGRTIGAINGGYLTTTNYDAAGNIVKQVQYVEQLSAANIGADLPSGVATDIPDTVLLRFYDNENNLVEQHSGWVQGLGQGRDQPITTYQYDAAGNLLERVIASGTSVAQTERYYYDTMNRLVAVYDVESKALSQSKYDKAGRVVGRVQYSDGVESANIASVLSNEQFSEVPDSNKRVQYVYDARGRMTRESEYLLADANGNNSIHTFYDYDQAGNLTQTRWGDLDSDGNPIEGGNSYSSENRYDNRGLLIASRAASGLYTRSEHNASGQVIRTWKGGGFSASFEVSLDYTWNEYNAIGDLIASNAGDGLWREYAVDAYGNKLKTTTYGLRLATETVGVFKARVNPTAIEEYALYDARALVTAEIDGLGQRTQFERDFLGRVTRVTSPRGGQTLRAYDGAGNLRMKKNAVDAEILYGYNHLGKKEIELQGESENGTLQFWTYDSRGNMVQTYWAGEPFTTAVNYEYDIWGRVTSITKGAQRAERISLTYDTKDRLTSVTNEGATTGAGDDETTTYWYDTRGNNTWTRDGNGHFFGRQFDASNQVTATYSFASADQNLFGGDDSILVSTISSATPYEAPNPITRLSDAKEEAADADSLITIKSSNVFDLYGYQAQSTDEDGKVTVYVSSAFGVLTSEARLGILKTFEYDAFNREILQTTEFTDEYTYAVVNKQYQTWDAADQLKKVDVEGTYTATNIQFIDSATTQYEYDADGNRVSEVFESVDRFIDPQRVISAKPRNATYTYDLQGRILTFRDSAYEGTTVLEFEYEYDQWGNKSKVTQRQQGQPVSVYTYSFDEANRISQEEFAKDGVVERTLTFTYNEAGRRQSQRREQLFRAVGLTPVLIDATTTYSYYQNGRIKDQTTKVINTAINDPAESYTSIERFWRYDKAGQEVETWENSLSLGEMAWLTTSEAPRANYDDAGNLKLVVQQRDAFTILKDWGDFDITRTFRDASGRANLTYKLNFYNGSATPTEVAVTDAIDAGLVSEATVNGFVLDPSGRVTEDFEIKVSGESKRTAYVYSEVDDQLKGIIAVEGGNQGVSQFVYNSRRQLITLSLGPLEEDGSPGVKYFYYDNDGNIVERSFVPAGGTTTDIPENVRYAYQNGKIVGAYSPILASSLTPADATALISGGTFDTVQSIGDSLPTPTSYVTADGSSLRSLAAQYYGSPDLWYVIAEANGITTGEAPKAGTRLVIPSSVDNAYHNANTHRLYSTETIIGSTIPNIEIPDNSCALVGAIIAIVAIAIIAVVLSVLTLGKLAAPLAKGGTAAALALLGAVSSGAGIAFVASAATQLILVEAGLQRDFDWEAVAVDSLIGGVAAGVAGIGAIASAAKTVNTFTNLAKTASKLGKVAKVVGAAALEVATEAASQAITKEKGEDFDALSLVAAGVSESVANVVDGVLDAAKASIKALRKTTSAADIAKSLDKVAGSSRRVLKQAKADFKQAKADFEFAKLRPDVSDKELTRLNSKFTDLTAKRKALDGAKAKLGKRYKQAKADFEFEKLRGVKGDKLDQLKQKLDLSKANVSKNNKTLEKSLINLDLDIKTDVLKQLKLIKSTKNNFNNTARLRKGTKEFLRGTFQDTAGFKAIGRRISADFKKQGLEVDAAEALLRATGKIATKGQKFALIGLKTSAAAAQKSIQNRDRVVGDSEGLLSSADPRRQKIGFLSLLSYGYSAANEINLRVTGRSLINLNGG